MDELRDKFLDRLHKELDKETDRSIVIVAGALLDEALKEIIKACLLPAVKRENCVFSSSNSPISSFSSRINLCYQLGLISQLMQRDLNIIRKMRNDFAHDPFHLSFDNDSIKNRIEELVKVAKFQETNPESRLNCGPKGTKYDFIYAISWRLYALTGLLKEIKPPKANLPEFGYLGLTPEMMKQIREKQDINPEMIKQILENHDIEIK